VCRRTVSPACLLGVAAIVFGCYRAPETPSRPQLPPSASDAAPSSAVPSSPLEPRLATTPQQALLDWIATRHTLYAVSPSELGPACIPITIEQHPGAQTTGHFGDSYLFEVTAGWLTLRRDQAVDIGRFDSAARGELARVCDESLALHGATDDSVLVGGSALYRDEKACLDRRLQYRPFHLRCEDTAAALSGAIPTAAWKNLAESLASGNVPTTSKPPECKLKLTLDALSTATRFEPNLLHVPSGWGQAELGEAPSILFAFDFYPSAGKVWLSGSFPGAPLGLPVTLGAGEPGSPLSADWLSLICNALFPSPADGSNAPSPSLSKPGMLNHKETQERSGEDWLVEQLATNRNGLILYVPIATGSRLRCEPFALRAVDSGQRGLAGSPKVLELDTSTCPPDSNWCARYELRDGALTVAGSQVRVSRESGKAHGRSLECFQRLAVVERDPQSVRMGDSLWYLDKTGCVNALRQLAPTQLQCPLGFHENP
jgi:hypothetical protein